MKIAPILIACLCTFAVTALPVPRAEAATSAADILFDVFSESGVDAAREKLAEMRADRSGLYGWQPGEFNSLGYRLRFRGKIPECLEAMKMGVEMWPDEWYLHDTLGEFAILVGDRDLAVRGYEKSLELEPENEGAVRALEGLDRAIEEAKHETRVAIGYDKPGEATGLDGPYLGQKPPGREPEVFAPGIVSTLGGHEFSCAFTPDGKEFYFNRGPHIHVCRWTEEGWTAPEFVSFNTRKLDHEPHVIADGSRLYFGSDRRREGEESYGIWYVERAGEGWGKPAWFGPGMYATSAANGNLYVTDTSGGYENAALAVYPFADGRHGEIEFLAAALDEPNGDAHPCIAPDESYIVFDSRRAGASGGVGDDDFYVSFRTDDGGWSEPVRLDGISTPTTNMCASLSPDGKYLFYAVYQDIWWVSAEILEDYRP